MSSPLTLKQWIIVIVVNVIVSTVTTLLIVRVMTNQPSSRAASAPLSEGSVSSDTAGTAPAANTQSTSAPNDSSPSLQETLPATLEVTTVPTQTTKIAPAVSRTAVVLAAKVRISAVLYPGQRQREVVVIVNEGNQIDLRGWTLSSSKTISYTFGNVTLFQDSFINLHTTTGADVPTDLFWNRSEPAWQTGDLLTLAYHEQVMATYKVK